MFLAYNNCYLFLGWLILARVCCIFVGPLVICVLWVWVLWMLRLCLLSSLYLDQLIGYHLFKKYIPLSQFVPLITPNMYTDSFHVSHRGPYNVLFPPLQFVHQTEIS
jgi:hypothetical protein